MGFFRSKKQPTTAAVPAAPTAVRGDAMQPAASSQTRMHHAVRPAASSQTRMHHAVRPAASSQTRMQAGAPHITPYLTEKSSTLAGQGTYTFVVPRDAEKIGIARAIVQRYGVTPVHVRTIRTAGKFLRYGRTVGHRGGVKKALVTLTKGETIPFGVKT